VKQNNWYQKLLDQQVIWEYPGDGPHAIYTINNRHSDFYINSDYLACKPWLTREVSQGLFDKLNSEKFIEPDWVLTYSPFGLHIGFCLAELYRCKFGFIKSLEEPDLYFDVKENENILLCADDVNSGNSMRKVILAVKNKGAKIIDKLAVVGNYSGNTKLDDIQIISLMEEDINVWPPEDCSLCKQGSQALSARKNWQKFTAAIESGVITQ
jgi:orotate phosphoribosyltransferase